MAMAYCVTCSMSGNFIKCPNRFIDEGDGAVIHTVIHDEPRGGIDDDRTDCSVDD